MTLLQRFFLIALLVILPMGRSALAEEFVMLTGAKQPYTNEDQTGFLDRIAGELFGALGHSVTVHSTPPARALLEVSQGKADGDMQRIAGLQDRVADIVPVPESVSLYEFAGFTLDENLDGRGLTDLAGRTVGYLRGWKYYENNLPQDVDAVVVDEPQQLLTLLQRGRIDVALFSRWSGLYWADQLGITVTPIEPSFHRLEMFIYMNQRHAGMVTDMAAVLAAMKQDGRYDRIFAETLGPLMRDLTGREAALPTEPGPALGS